MPDQIIIATRNKGKVKEIRHILKSLKLKIISLLDMPNIPDIKENGKTFKANAIKKASTIAKKLNAIVIADDSGLEVMALGKKPGVRSARYAGPNPTTEKLCRKLLKAMAKKKYRWARFVCDIAIAKPNGKVIVVEGVCWGKIVDRMVGNKGFGYDPVFIPEGYRKTFAQMPMSLKNRLSHRGKALKKAKACLARIFPS
jgi:non-canonical purine NTP pyrophosphatase (RdgB/HAM1 family)